MKKIYLYIALILLGSIVLVSCMKKPERSNEVQAPINQKEVTHTEVVSPSIEETEPEIIDNGALAPLKLVTSGGNEIVVVWVVEGESIASPLKISGEVPSSWVFEGIFPISIVNNNEKILAEWYGTAEWIDEQGNFIEWPVSFSSEFTFDIPQTETTSGFIRFAKDIVGDQDEEDYVDIPVTWWEEESGSDPIGSIPEWLSDVEAGIVDYTSCEAGGWEVNGNICTSTDWRVFENIDSGQDPLDTSTDWLSHVEAGMVDYASCEAGGGEIQQNTCITFDGRIFEK